MQTSKPWYRKEKRTVESTVHRGRGGGDSLPFDLVLVYNTCL